MLNRRNLMEHTLKTLQLSEHCMARSPSRSKGSGHAASLRAPFSPFLLKDLKLRHLVTCFSISQKAEPLV